MSDKMKKMNTFTPSARDESSIKLGGTSLHQDNKTIYEEDPFGKVDSGDDIS
jgi:hypothetical protein